MRAVGDCCIRKIRDGEGERRKKARKRNVMEREEYFIIVLLVVYPNNSVK